MACAVGKEVEQASLGIEDGRWRQCTRDCDALPLAVAGLVGIATRHRGIESDGGEKVWRASAGLKRVFC
jgi:hypothetical protein